MTVTKKERRSVGRVMSIALLVGAMFLNSGCSGEQINSRTEYTVGGAVIGGLAGSAFGGGSGRVLGAAIGAGAGGLLGNYLWKESKHDE